MIEVYAVRAVQLKTARQYLLDGDEFASATALLAIHAAISLNDAVRSLLGDQALTSEDHYQAVRSTLRLCKAKKIDPIGVKHLSALLNSKSDVSYGRKIITPSEAKQLAESAKRFEAWAYKNFKELTQWDRSLLPLDA